MFNIGEKVMCVDSGMLSHTVAELITDVPNWVKKDTIYTIRGFADHDFVVGVYLEEIRNLPKWFTLIKGYYEPAFAEWRFRKLSYSEIEALASEILEEELSKIEL